jgi:intracellular multiplication protein IcmS
MATKKTISEKLVQVVAVLGARYTLNSRPISLVEIFSETGLLPAIARRADQLSSLCLGYGIGVTFEETEGARLKTKAKFDTNTPEILRYLCVMDVMNELVRAASSRDAVPLDELLYD